MTKTDAQLDADIKHFLANPKVGDPEWERDWADLLAQRHSKARMPSLDELARAFMYIEREYVLRDGSIDMEQWAEGLAFGRYAGDAEAKRQAGEALKQLPSGAWLRAAERANYLSEEQGEKSRYLRSSTAHASISKNVKATALPNVPRSAKDLTGTLALRLPRFEFIAYWLAVLTKKKEYRGRLGLYVKHVGKKWQVVSPIGGGTVTYETTDPALLFDYARRGQLGTLIRDAEQFRGMAYEDVARKRGELRQR